MHPVAILRAVFCTICSLSMFIPCGSGAFSLEEGRIAPLPLHRHVARGDYLDNEKIVASYVQMALNISCVADLYVRTGSDQPNLRVECD